ncbi:MAG: SMI1/KNR4 family protein [Planctomycetaceae bacterium]|jgi:hypothetical protein|nr:SMI1/KNR4 family protein [Planctomycetaceae bacterium]
MQYFGDYKTTILRILRKLRLLGRTTDLCINKGLSPNEIDIYCESNDLILPKEVKFWLSLCNGIHIGKKDIPITFGEFYGLNLKKSGYFCMDIMSDLIAHPHWKKSGYIPLCSDGCGSMYMLVPKNYNNKILYPVGFFDHSDSRENLCDNPSQILVSNFLTFVDFALTNEICIRRYKNYDISMPFSKNIIMKHDPYSYFIDNIH